MPFVAPVMADTRTEDPGSPLQWLRRTLRAMWNDARSVYYANTMIWRLLKSGALLFLGLFTWVGANLILSYRGDWWPFYYVMAYGFVLLVWGPLTHFLVVPTVIRLRRTAATDLWSWFARHGSKVNLAVFFTIVLLLGTFPVGPMTFEFQLPSGGETSDVNPQLQCTMSGETIHCHLSSSRGIDHVVVTASGQEIERIEEPPFDFDVDVSDTGAVREDRQFVVDLRDENGETMRRYVRRVDLIPG